MQQRRPQNSPRFFLVIILFASLAMLVAGSSFAATITKIRGKKVYVKTSGEDMEKGDIFVTVTRKGRKKGLIRIRKVRGSKAIGKLIKGRAKRGWKLKSRKNMMSKRSRKGSRKRAKASKFTVGLLAGMNLNSMNVKLNNGAAEVAMSGSATSIKLISDLNLWDSIGLRATLGTDTFSVKGTTTGNLCSSSNDCATEINYLSIYVLGRYFLTNSDMKFWLGAGFGLLNPSSATSNNINVEQVKLTSSMTPALGLDYTIGKSLYIPIQATYNILPSSDEATASFISVQAGIAYKF